MEFNGPMVPVTVEFKVRGEFNCMVTWPRDFGLRIFSPASHVLLAKYFESSVVSVLRAVISVVPSYSNLSLQEVSAKTDYF